MLKKKKVKRVKINDLASAKLRLISPLQKTEDESYDSSRENDDLDRWEFKLPTNPILTVIELQRDYDNEQMVLLELDLKRGRD